MTHAEPRKFSSAHGAFWSTSGKSKLLHVTVLLVKCHFTTDALLAIDLYKYEKVVPVVHEVEADKDDIIRVAMFW